jgi:endogenous inhibitor of DNA gyrase (YacG/DUF329 family)
VTYFSSHRCNIWDLARWVSRPHHAQ